MRRTTRIAPCTGRLLRVDILGEEKRPFSTSEKAFIMITFDEQCYT